MSSAVLIKMINGDELIAEIIYEDDSMYIFHEPMALVEKITPDGSVIDVLTNYVNMAKEFDVEIKKSHIICVNLLAENFQRYYEISKVYHKKHIRPGRLKEVDKVTDAMEEILFSPAKKITEPKMSVTSTANNTLH